MNGAYWGLTTLDLLGKLDAVNSDEIIQWIMKCQHESGFTKILFYLPYSLVIFFMYFYTYSWDSLLMKWSFQSHTRLHWYFGINYWLED